MCFDKPLLSKHFRRPVIAVLFCIFLVASFHILLQSNTCRDTSSRVDQRSFHSSSYATIQVAEHFLRMLASAQVMKPQIPNISQRQNLRKSYIMNKERPSECLKHGNILTDSRVIPVCRFSETSYTFILQFVYQTNLQEKLTNQYS